MHKHGALLYSELIRANEQFDGFHCRDVKSLIPVDPPRVATVKQYFCQSSDILSSAAWSIL